MHDNSLPVLTAIATVLMMLASAAQWRARNLGTLLNIGWILVGNLNFFLNSVIWRDHSEDTAPVFCDICESSRTVYDVTEHLAVRFQAALQTAISGASLCVTRRLAAIASSQSINVSQRRKHINLWIDLGCGIGLPAFVMATSYVVQGRRFLIWEGYGCEFAGSSTIPSYFILCLWPLLLSAISAIYGGTCSSVIKVLSLTTS
jgi:pheromone a factor receptor